jgi:hypothetical protein
MKQLGTIGLVVGVASVWPLVVASAALVGQLVRLRVGVHPHA